MRVLQLTIALLAVACCAWAESNSDWKVQLTHQSSTGVRGSFSQGTSKRMNFHALSDQDGNRALSLRRADGKNLLQANWTSSKQRLDVSRFRVMRTTMRADLGNDPTTAQQTAESKAFDEFRQTSEFKSLPILSQILGTKYNVTGYENAAALSLHRLSVHAENMHRTLAEHDAAAAPAKHRVKRCDLGLNPWSACTSATFKCGSLSGYCDKTLLDYTSPGSCNYRGTPINPSDYSGGCTGLCGPGCEHCWTYICGDCCIHPGCSQHDGECSSGYLTVDCLTAKGVLWGGGNSASGYADNC